MGLDTSHDCWTGAYSAFTRWRNKVASVAGYAVCGFVCDSEIRSPRVMLNWGHVTEDNLYGEWDRTPDDPLLVLIAHSDCDGVIHPEQAGPLADRLAELLPLLPDEDGGGHIGNWRAKTQAFIDGLRAAVLAGEDVTFH